MTKLVSGVPVKVYKGILAYNAVISTGTFDISFEIDDEGPSSVASGSATENGKLSLPDCMVTATLGGDAVLAIGKIENS